ncbi:metal-dependent transcriptional regulator [Salinibacterium sp. NSLL150]|uniref:metal-dependent transcriptional regulator n=1 Tax=unclassified Salinibacterium TaxID=2632331 RepID=UPI0018CFC7D5|nr:MULTISPECIES: metal-dependent transcriptional regulator [unclassified Salinibacterium]MBH0099985.1 metal-dependent transcriptional regulator [Salinibacterium sp. NSLL35]MBH0102739.1 metal-dependent transcriptional regulator [Salinibacterium sp. NSLL150]MBH0105499.1 metal-dependent transcriptional regulator [Salinibacterium sp. NSLL16]MBH0108259.1 metal-dependent transcriptional regulator [Salinibacterium sp. NSLL17]MBH0117197.1 metal-dependent transcriptional regulator [Salinibacterium sp. 
MSVTELSVSTQNYLKTVWSLSEWSDAPVTATVIAERTGYTLSSVSDAVRRLTDQGFLDHARYGSIALTAVGSAHAVAMVRRHRLIESFLVSVLGYTWDQVHDEAENLEHAVSDFMVERIDEFLEHPTRDPHGDPIPSADGVITIPDAVQLSRVAPGSTVVVERISDDDPELLKFFEERGIGFEATLSVNAGAPYSDALEVVVLGGVGGETGGASGEAPGGAVRQSAVPISLGRSATDALYVSGGTLAE